MIELFHDSVIQSNLMDLEFAEVCNSRSEEVGGMVAESEKNGGLKACSTDGSYLHDDHQEHQVHSPNLQDKMHVQKEVQFDEPKDRCGPVSDTTLSNKGEPRDPAEGNSAARNLNKAPLDSGEFLKFQKMSIFFINNVKYWENTSINKSI